MTRQVWKFPLELVDGPQVVRMPGGANVVHVGSQPVYNGHEQVCIWAEVDPYRILTDRWFTVEGTGHPIHEGGRHVGTAITEHGLLVWHVYEVAP